MVRRYAPALVRVGSMIAAVILTWPSGLTARQATPAAQAPLPAAREIIDRYVKATGGTIAFKGISSMRAKGVFTITGQSLSGQLDMMAARPNKLLTRITIDAIGTMEEGFDGKVAWSIDPFRGPALTTGRGLTERADEAWFDALLHGSDHVKEMVVVGKEDFDGRPCYRLKVVSLRGTEQFELFDAATGLQAGFEATRDTPFGLVPTTTFYREYQRFGQLTFPSRVVQKILGQEQVLHFTTYEYDSVPPATFDLPAVIKALIK